MYQAAAEKWVEAGATSHAVALYAHDRQALDSFFWNGFGLRCVDAIRPLEDIPNIGDEKYSFRELLRSEISDITPLKNKLISHLSKSPCFLSCSQLTDEDAINIVTRRNSRIFVAKNSKTTIAFIEVSDRGENFLCDESEMKNICGAYCLPE